MNCLTQETVPQTLHALSLILPNLWGPLKPQLGTGEADNVQKNLRLLHYIRFYFNDTKKENLALF